LAIAAAVRRFGDRRKLETVIGRAISVLVLLY
jgi:hypothetical protein